MNDRNRSRRRPPRVVEALEPRVALSHAPTFGAVGDSLSDEYRFYPPDRSHARNWVETLAATRRVDFGAYTTGRRAFPRGQGYAQDWARSSATTSDVVATQVAGLAGQVAAGRVEYASVNMGTNDFLFFLQASFTTARPASAAEFAANLQAVATTATANLDRTVGTLLAANPAGKVIVATIPDVRQVPLVAGLAADPTVAAATTAVAVAEAAYNDHIRAVAAANPGRVAVADVAAQGTAFLAGGAKTRPFGGTTVRLRVAGNGYRDFVVGDQIHPGTIAQGLIANAEVAAANSLGAAIRPLAPREIVRRARLVAAHPSTAR